MWAPVRVWAKGLEGVVVEWILIEEAPEAERIWVGVTAREKMSVMCAGEGQLDFGCGGGAAKITIVDRMRGEILFRLKLLASFEK